MSGADKIAGGNVKFQGGHEWKVSESHTTTVSQPEPEPPPSDAAKAVQRLAGRAADAFQHIKSNPLSTAGDLLKVFTGESSAGGLQPAIQAAVDIGLLLKDVAVIADSLTDQPLETLLDLGSQIPLTAIQSGLQLGETGLQALENATGWKVETSGKTVEQDGTFTTETSQRELPGGATQTTTAVHREGTETVSTGRAKIGVGGADAKGSVTAWTGVAHQEKTVTEGSLGRATVVTGGRADATATVGGKAHAGLAGVKADGKAEVKTGAGVSASGQVDGFMGAQAGVSAKAEVEAYARVTGSAKADITGVKASAKAEAGVMANAEVAVNLRSPGVDIGGERLDVNAKGKAFVSVGAYAEAHADVKATVEPPAASANIGASAFVGAKAGVEGTVGIGKFAALTGHAEGWAGAGAEAGIKLGYSEGKLSFSMGAGTAVGYGVGAGWGLEVDVGAIAMSAIGGTIDLISASPDLIAQGLSAADQAIEDASAIAAAAPAVVSGVIDEVTDWLSLWN